MRSLLTGRARAAGGPRGPWTRGRTGGGAALEVDETEGADRFPDPLDARERVGRVNAVRPFTPGEAAYRPKHRADVPVQ